MAKDKNIQLQFEPDLDHFLMDYDADKLMHIVTNLVSNALKYVQEGGSVKVTTGLLPGKGSNKRIIMVRENGPGIHAHHLPFIILKIG